MSRCAVAILSTENLLHNLRAIAEKVAPAKMIAMVKANAYGHGLRSVGLRVQERVGTLGVASIDEALALRTAGVYAQLVLMQGVYEPHEILIASQQGFQVVFNTMNQVTWLQKTSLPTPLSCWIKVNTGLGRLGFSPEEAPDIHTTLTNHEGTQKPVGMLSHFSCADTPDHPLNQKQIKVFESLRKTIKAPHSLCNSGGILHFPHCFYDYVRPGILLYGVSPLSGVTAQSLGLKPVMTVQSRIMAIQSLKKGDYVGYGARYQCPEDMSVGIVAFGYGDGYPPTARDGTPVLVHRTVCSLVGKVSMDMIAVDLRKCPQACVGDPVTLWGDGLPLETVAPHTMNSVWEIVTSVQNRVKFLWTSRESHPI